MEKAAKGLVDEVGTEVTEQSQKCSASRLVCRNHFSHRIPATGTKEKGNASSLPHSCKSTWKYTTIYCQECDIGLCLRDCFEIYQTKVNYWDKCFMANTTTSLGCVEV
jgi:hypothetical protein